MSKNDESMIVQINPKSHKIVSPITTILIA